MSRDLCVFPLLGLQSRKGIEQAGLVRGDELFDVVVKLQGGHEVEEVFLSPRAGEVSRDVLDGFLATMVTKHVQPDRIALSGDDGADDGHARGPGEIGDGSMDLHVHLVEGLLHPLHVAGPLFD